MTKQLTAEQLAELTVEQLLDLNSADIAELEGFQLHPLGAYSGILQSATIPDPKTGKNYFEFQVLPTAIIELSDESQRETAQSLLDSKSVIKTRYYTDKGFGIAAMNTEFGAVISASGGVLGAFFARAAEEQIPVNFLVEHRASKPKKNATAAEKAAFTPQTYAELKQVTPA